MNIFRPVWPKRCHYADNKEMLTNRGILDGKRRFDSVEIYARRESRTTLTKD